MTTTRKALAVAALLFGGLIGNATSGYSVAAAGNQQCYYRAGIDVENSCNTCSSTCLGDGYRCCTIIADIQ